MRLLATLLLTMLVALQAAAGTIYTCDFTEANINSTYEYKTFTLGGYTWQASNARLYSGEFYLGCTSSVTTIDETYFPGLNEAWQSSYDSYESTTYVHALEVECDFEDVTNIAYTINSGASNGGSMSYFVFVCINGSYSNVKNGTVSLASGGTIEAQLSEAVSPSKIALVTCTTTDGTRNAKLATFTVSNDAEDEVESEVELKAQYSCTFAESGINSTFNYRTFTLGDYTWKASSARIYSSVFYLGGNSGTDYYNNTISSDYFPDLDEAWKSQCTNYENVNYVYALSVECSYSDVGQIVYTSSGVTDGTTTYYVFAKVDGAYKHLQTGEVTKDGGTITVDTSDDPIAVSEVALVICNTTTTSRNMKLTSFALYTVTSADEQVSSSTPTSVQSVSVAGRLKAYVGAVGLQVETAAHQAVSVFNIIGQRLATKSSSTGRVEFQQLSKGQIYILQAGSDVLKVRY